MPFGPALARERYDAVVQLLRDTDLPLTEIGARTGVNPNTVSTWNVRAGYPRPKRLSRADGPEAWEPGRRAAMVRLFREPRNDPGDLAEVTGLRRTDAAALFRALGQPERPPEGAPPELLAEIGPLGPDGVADAPTLRGQLRAHIARQIAAFDAGLRGEGAAVIDSARVLRDLGGLKRLFDEVAHEKFSDGAGERGDGGTGADPVALRAEIARRYARFGGAGHAA